MNTKICRSCKVEKPIREFSRREHNEDGLDARCKLCIREYMARRCMRKREAGELPSNCDECTGAIGLIDPHTGEWWAGLETCSDACRRTRAARRHRVTRAGKSWGYGQKDDRGRQKSSDEGALVSDVSILDPDYVAPGFERVKEHW